MKISSTKSIIYHSKIVNILFLPLVFQKGLSCYQNRRCLFVSLPCYGNGLMFDVVHFLLIECTFLHILWSITNFYILDHFPPHTWYVFLILTTLRMIMWTCTSEIECSIYLFLHISCMTSFSHGFLITLNYDAFT